jgi:hypothetical protein
MTLSPFLFFFNNDKNISDVYLFETYHVNSLRALQTWHISTQGRRRTGRRFALKIIQLYFCSPPASPSQEKHEKMRERPSLIFSIKFPLEAGKNEKEFYRDRSFFAKDQKDFKHANGPYLK